MARFRHTNLNRVDQQGDEAYVTDWLRIAMLARLIALTGLGSSGTDLRGRW